MSQRKEDINVILACLASPPAPTANAQQTWRKLMDNSYGQLNDVLCDQKKWKIRLVTRFVDIFIILANHGNASHHTKQLKAPFFQTFYPRSWASEVVRCISLQKYRQPICKYLHYDWNFSIKRWTLKHYGIFILI
jgi:hypothetical protein